MALLPPVPGRLLKAWLDRLDREGVLMMVGASGGTVNTGICISEAPDEETARDVVSKDPVAGSGYAPGELRPFNLGLLRGGMRDSEEGNQA